LSFIITNVKNEVTNLCENEPVQHDCMNIFCEIKANLSLGDAVSIELGLFDGLQVRLRVVVFGLVHPLPLPAASSRQRATTKMLCVMINLHVFHLPNKLLSN